MPGAGRPKFVPTEEERKAVTNYAMYGVPHLQICHLVRDGISVDTLKIHFKKELEYGKALAASGVGGTIYRKAMDGDLGAAVWYSKTQMGWSDKITIAGDPNAPLVTKVERVIVDKE